MVIFVAGLSGAGKTVAAARSEVLPTLALDSYFHDEQHNPAKWLGRPDWETIRAFDSCAAVRAVRSLASGDPVSVPIYDHATNRTVGTAAIQADGSFVAEGVYATVVYDHAVRQGIDARLLLIDTSAHTQFVARIRRDIGQRRMNPIWALARSLRLLARHWSYRRHALARGAMLVTRSAAPASIAAAARGPTSAWHQLLGEQGS